MAKIKSESVKKCPECGQALIDNECVNPNCEENPNWGEDEDWNEDWNEDEFEEEEEDD